MLFLGSFVIFFWGSFFKMDFRRRPFNQKPLALGEIQKPIWRYFVMKLPSNLPSNVEKWTFRCHVRPNPAEVRDNVFVCSVRSPRTPPDLLNFNLIYEKNSFCEKLDFSVFTVCFVICWPYMGPKKTHGANKRHEKGRHFINKCRFVMFFKFPSLFLWCFGFISGNIKPPGGCWDKSRVFGNPDFGKKSSLKTVWLICFNDLPKPVSKNISVAL